LYINFLVWVKKKNSNKKKQQSFAYVVNNSKFEDPSSRMSKKEDTQEWENEYDQVSFLSKSQNPAIAPIWFDTQNNPQCGDPPIFEYKYSQFI